jgi:hypothetical protein
MLDSRWPHVDSQANVVSPSGVSLLHMGLCVDTVAECWGPSLAAACIRPRHPGDISQVLLSQRRARQLLSQHIHEFPPSPFIPPADSLRFISTLHRGFNSLAEAGCVPFGAQAQACPSSVSAHMWQLYTTWWTIKGVYTTRRTFSAQAATSATSLFLQTVCSFWNIVMSMPWR